MNIYEYSIKLKWIYIFWVQLSIIFAFFPEEYNRFYYGQKAAVQSLLSQTFLRNEIGMYY